MTIAALLANAPLRIGSSGDTVKLVQLALKEIGYPLTGTGFFGNATDTAVEAFQKRAGLKVDGEVGFATGAALDMAMSGTLQHQEPVARQETSRPLWLSVSLDHLNLREGAGSTDNKELVADIKTVAPDYQHDATPWCAGWVSFCLAKAEQKPSSQPLWALSYSDTRNEPVIKLAGPALGAIAVKTRNGGGHVTFVAGRTRSGALACCGGNQNDMVNVSPYLQSAFVGFYWPKGAPLPGAVGVSSLPIVSTNGQSVTSEK